MERFDLRLKSETLELLKSRAQADNRSVSAMARLIIENALKECKHKFAAYQSIGNTGGSTARCHKCGFEPNPFNL